MLRLKTEELKYLFFAGEGVRFDVDDSGVKSVVFLVNNCLITDVRLLLVVAFSSSCFLFNFSFDDVDSFVVIFFFFFSVVCSLLSSSCFRFLEPN
jgi:hypothetical protein